MTNLGRGPLYMVCFLPPLHSIIISFLYLIAFTQTLPYNLMPTPLPRFSSRPGGIVSPSMPISIDANLAAIGGILHTRHTHIKAVFVVADAVDPHVNAFTHTTMRLGDASNNDGNYESFEWMQFLDVSSIDFLSGGSLKGEPDATDDAPGGFSGNNHSSFLDLGGPPKVQKIADIPKLPLGVRYFIDAPLIISGQTLLGDLQGNSEVTRCIRHASSIGLLASETPHEGVTSWNSDISGHVLSGSAPTPVPPSQEVNYDRSHDSKAEDEEASSPHTGNEGDPPPPPPPPPSFSPSGNNCGTHRTTFLDWKYVVIALIVFFGLKQISHCTFRRSSFFINRGQEKKLINNKTKPRRCIKNPGQIIADSPLWVANHSQILHHADFVAFVHPNSPGRCSYHLSTPCEFKSASILYNNSTFEILAPDSPSISACGVVQCGFGLIHPAVFFGLLVTILLAYVGTCLTVLAMKLFQSQINNLIESSLDNTTFEQIENAVPGTLLLDTMIPTETSMPMRSAPPLGCVFLTPSGPCTVDPRPTRQLSLEEEKQIFGLPIDTPVSAPSLSVSPPSSFLAGSSQPGSHKGPRKVTFAEENEVFVFQPNTATRYRNLRRRLSGRAMAAAGGNR